MKPYINIQSEGINYLKDLYQSVKNAGFEVFDGNMEKLTMDKLPEDIQEIIVKTKDPETLIKFTEPEKYKTPTEDDPFPYYSIALKPLEPYLMCNSENKEYINLAAYLELYMQMTEGKYIRFMKSHGF